MNNISAMIRVGDYIYATSADTVAGVVKIDISTPATPTFTSETYSPYVNANGIDYDTVADRLIVTCDSGVVLYIIPDTLVLDDTYDLDISTNLFAPQLVADQKIIFTFSDDTDGVLYRLDNATVNSFAIQTGALRQYTPSFKLHQGAVKGFKGQMQTGCLVQNRPSFRMDTRFGFADPIIPTQPVQQPSSLLAFKVYLDNVQVSDVALDTIQVTVRDTERASATFRVARLHDKPDYTLAGVYQQITAHNDVRITFNDVELFTGKVNKLVLQTGTEESVEISCVGLVDWTVDDYSFKTIDLALSDNTHRRSMYDVIANDITIDDPYIDPNDPNPTNYNGVLIDLGTGIVDSANIQISLPLTNNAKVVSYQPPYVLTNEIDEWKPEIGVEYFWFIYADLFDILKGKIASVIDEYIGTSLSSSTSDLWNLTEVYNYYQTTQHVEHVLGNYTIGAAPFKTISGPNGYSLVSGYGKLEDRDNGLWQTWPAQFDYLDHARSLADVEYEKMKNINGDLFPQTSATIDMTLDAFLYYGIKLLMRLNVVNTTQANIYKNANGFPVAVKGWTISAGNMRVSLSTDNQKSDYELEQLDITMTKPQHDYPAVAVHKFNKYDLQNRKLVE
jgi:hypothetical protein